MSMAFMGEHRAPTMFTLVSDVIGGSVIVLDGPERGDILIKAVKVSKSLPIGPSLAYTHYFYYLVTGVNRPNGICHGHSLLTVEELKC